MQITLLPPLLPSDGVVSVPATHQAFTPGARIEATVLGTSLDGGTLLSLAGREVPTSAALPYPAGTRVRLEIVEAGPQPLLRLVSAEAGSTGPPDAKIPVASSSDGPPVSSVTYALAAAVLAAREGPDVRAAATALARFLPALISSGLLGRSQGEALVAALAPVRVDIGAALAGDDIADTGAVARAIADRVSEGGLLLERRLAEIVRHARPEARAAAARDLRAQLARVADLLEHAPHGLDGAREAVARLQEAVLAEQARVAAHLARDGVVDVRVPLQVGEADAVMRLRMRIKQEVPARGVEDDQAPWRQVVLDFALEGLGRVQVRVGVARSQVRTEFLVEHPDSADRLEAALPELQTALGYAGFAEVLSRVVVDPVRACETDELPDLPSQGRILDTHA